MAMDWNALTRRALVLALSLFSTSILPHELIANEGPWLPSASVGRKTHKCLQPIENAAIEKLCPLPSRRIDFDAFEYLRDRLTTDAIDDGSLCAIESLLIRSLGECDLVHSTHTRERLGELLRMTAGSWQQRDEFAKADEVYAVADAEMASQSVQYGRIELLKAWAEVKIELGDIFSARTLADKQASLARQAVSNAPSSHIAQSVLAHALYFQSHIYEIIGMALEAITLREEAEEIERQSPLCDGLCN